MFLPVYACNCVLHESIRNPWQKQRTGPVSFFSIFQIITANFLFSRELFKMAPSLMSWMETS